MKSYDIVGYTYDADVYCVNCADLESNIDSEGNEKHPIFAGSEFEHEIYCSVCHEQIDVCVTNPQTLELIEDRYFPDMDFGSIAQLNEDLIKSVRDLIIAERDNLSDYRNSDIEGYVILVHTIRSNDTCKIDDILAFVQSYYDEEINFIDEEKDDFNENIDFCELFIERMISNMVLPDGLEFYVGSTDFGEYGIIAMFDDSNIEDILNY